MKPKLNKAGSLYEPKGYDQCQTPGYGIKPLLPYLNFPRNRVVIWECAAGKGNLVKALLGGGFDNVVGTDIIEGKNFFEVVPEWPEYCIVTNPPYSIKYDWIERCYELNVPWALLMPVETLGAKTAQVMFDKFGMGIILLDKRINFEMPEKGYSGAGAQFPVAWYTHGLGIDGRMIYAHVERG